MSTEVQLVFDKLFGAVYARWAAPQVRLEGGAQCWTLYRARCTSSLVHLSISDSDSFDDCVGPAKGLVW
jgi:hypothetical protein